MTMLSPGMEGPTVLEGSGRPEEIEPYRGKRRRRSWTLEAKRRIVEESLAPGASVAEVARRHGMNSNQLFIWRQQALEGRFGATPMPVAEREPLEFIPIGVFERGENTPALLAPPSLTTGAAAGRVAPGLPAARREREERRGLIEIDMPTGARLRVDSFVDGKALRRVLKAMKDLP